MARIFFTVTNDLNYDQRMQRICGSLAMAGYDVTLVGRKLSISLPIVNQPFKQIRLHCFFNKGVLFYAEFNFRLFFYLLFKRTDAICAIDLDTILPCLLVSSIRRKIRIYDAHELFCEMKEIVSRPRVYQIWKKIEQFSVPHFRYGYTVNHLIADEFRKMYGVDYGVIRSVSVYHPPDDEVKREKFIIYQGAVNEGRCFESLVPAMRNIDANLVICGGGNFLEQAKALAEKFQVKEKVIFMGLVKPDALRQLTRKAYVGITLFEKESKSNYYSLANRFFDYMHAGVPQICVNYPLYREIFARFPAGILINEPTEAEIAREINELLQDPGRWEELHRNCLLAASTYNWQEEEKSLLKFYKDIFGKTPAHHHA